MTLISVLYYLLVELEVKYYKKCNMFVSCLYILYIQLIFIIQIIYAIKLGHIFDFSIFKIPFKNVIDLIG